MLFMPFQILGMFLRAIFSVALLGIGAFLLYQWSDQRNVLVTEPPSSVQTIPVATQGTPRREVDGQRDAQPGQTHMVAWEFGWNRATAYLLIGVGLLTWSLGGRWLGRGVWRRRGNDEPTSMRSTAVQRVKRPDGSVLQVEFFGPADAPPIVLTHGWGLDGDDWYYAKKELAGRYRLIVWDLPGLGLSTSPANKDWSLEKLARDLDAVISLAGNRPVTLLGHSIGGMINLTYCRLFRDTLGTRVSSLIIVNSTYTNPVKTTSMAWLYSAIQKPVLEPLCYLMVGLAPVFWVLNWLSYLNGSAHRSTDRSSFSGKETRGQLNFITHYTVEAWPAVVARGMLGMMNYDATATLASIPVPTLVVTGSKDTTCLPEASDVMAKTIPNAQLVSLQDARHCAAFEYHDKFAESVVEFLADAHKDWRVSPAVAVGPTDGKNPVFI